MVVLPLTRVATARGEEAPVDSTAVKTGLIKSIAPSYSGSISGDVIKVRMSNSISNRLEFSNGLEMTTSLKASESNTREEARNRRNKSNDFSHIVFMKLKSGFEIKGSFANSRMNDRSVNSQGAIQGSIVNNKNASADANYKAAITKDLNLDGWMNAILSSGKNNNIEKKKLDGSIGAGISYKFGDRISASARGFVQKSGEKSEAGAFRFDGLGSTADSLRSMVSVQVTDSANVDFEYVRFNSTRDFMDLPYSTFNEQDFQSVNVVPERELQNTRIMELKASVKPIRGVTFKLSAKHAERDIEYTTAASRTTRTYEDVLTGDLSYAIWKNTTMSLNLSRSEVFHGRWSIAYNSDEDKYVFRTSLNHTFTPTFNFNISANTTFSQIFNDEAIEKDRDQLSQGLSLTINSNPFPKIKASIALSTSSMEHVFIDGSKSGKNRKETTYDLTPKITYNLNDRIEIQQNYNLNIGFSDYVFTEEENFLDRNIRFSNRVLTKLSESLEVVFGYNLHIHDGGSYLRENPNAERLLSINSKDRRNETKINIEYKINSHLSVVCEHDYSRRVSRVVASGGETEFTDGGIKGGLEGEYKWGTGQSISFKLLKANRFGKFIPEPQKDFWEMNSRVSYKF